VNDLDRLKRQAESIFGKESVERIAADILGAAQSDPLRRDLVDVQRATFRNPQANESQEKHKEEELPVRYEARLPAERPEQTESPIVIDAVLEPVSSTSSPISRPTQEPNTPAKTNDSSTERVIAQAIKGEYLYATLGLILGLAAIIGGVILGLNGVAGSTSWTAQLIGLQSEINDAAPGVVLFIVGLFMIWATKPKVKLKDLKDE